MVHTKKNLKDLSEKERELWRVFDKVPFEKQIAVDNIGVAEVLDDLEFTKYFELLKCPLPENRDGIIEALIADDMISKLIMVSMLLQILGQFFLQKI